MPMTFSLKHLRYLLWLDHSHDPSSPEKVCSRQVVKGGGHLQEGATITANLCKCTSLSADWTRHLKTEVDLALETTGLSVEWASWRERERPCGGWELRRATSSRICRARTFRRGGDAGINSGTLAYGCSRSSRGLLRIKGSCTEKPQISKITKQNKY